MRRVITYASFVAALVFASGFIPAQLRASDLLEETFSLCEHLDAGMVVAKGWPLAFMYDGNVTSPVCSTGWSQIFLFEDVVIWSSLLLNVLFYAAVIAILFLSHALQKRF